MVAMEKQKILHICVCMRIRACSLAYPACHAFAPYCDVICGPSVFAIFFAVIFGKKGIEREMSIFVS
jgi:hypothetical protein